MHCKVKLIYTNLAQIKNSNIIPFLPDVIFDVKFKKATPDPGPSKIVSTSPKFRIANICSRYVSFGPRTYIMVEDLTKRNSSFQFVD